MEKRDKTAFDPGTTQPEGKSLEDLLAELEAVARERMGEPPASSATAPDSAATVYESAATEPDPAVTVYESAATVVDSAATQFDDGDISITAAALSDAAGRTDAPASNLSIQKGDFLLDTYEVDSDAIEGGMGSVWRVHHTGWNADLAMKRPLPACFSTEKSKADFIHECEAWIKLGLHPNIVSCYYVREISGTPSIFSEWMDGGSLESTIRDGTLYAGTEAEQQERILDIAIQFARGLHYAHEAGLIHQDVKPDNLLLTKEGDAKVADFGLARARAVLTRLDGNATVADETADSGRTIASPAGGYTPAYCSMEQMDGKTLTRRTDIYSWAVSVMELYVGSRPWANGVVAGLSCRDYFEDTKLPMPEALRELLAQCMEAEPDDRPHDFAEIEGKLQEIYRAETGGAYPRPASKAAADTADSLNNRALSMLDLGKPEAAERLWERALALNDEHVQSALNQALYLARKSNLGPIGWRAYTAQRRFTVTDRSYDIELQLAALAIEGGLGKAAREALARARRRNAPDAAILPLAQLADQLPGPADLREKDGPFRLCYQGAQSPDGRYAVFSDTLFDRETNRKYSCCLGEGLIDRDGRPRFSRDGTILGIHCRHGQIAFFRSDSGALMRVLSVVPDIENTVVQDYALEDFRFSPCEDILVAVGMDGTWLHELEICPNRLTLNDSEKLAGTPAYAVWFSPDGRRMAVLEKERIRVYEMYMRRAILSIAHGLHVSHVYTANLAFSHDNRRLFWVGDHAEGREVDFATFTKLHAVDLETGMERYCRGGFSGKIVGFSPDDRWLVTRYELLHLATGRSVSLFQPLIRGWNDHGKLEDDLHWEGSCARFYSRNLTFEQKVPPLDWADDHPLLHYEAPYRLCRVQNAQQHEQERLQYGGLLNLASQALESGDIDAALLAMERVREMPAFAKDRAAQALWRQIGRRCKRIGLRTVRLLEKKMDGCKFLWQRRGCYIEDEDKERLGRVFLEPETFRPIASLPPLNDDAWDRWEDAGLRVRHQIIDWREGTLYLLCSNSLGDDLQGIVRIFDLHTGCMTRSSLDMSPVADGYMDYIDAGVSDAALLPEGYAALGAKDTVVCVWDIKTGALLYSFQTQRDVKDLKFLPEDSRCVILNKRPGYGRLCVYNFRTGELLEEVELPSEAKKLCVAENKSRLATVGDKSVKWIDNEQGEGSVFWASMAVLWDTKTMTPMGQIDANGYSDLEHVAFAPDGRFVLRTRYPGILLVWDSWSQRDVFRTEADEDWSDDFALDHGGDFLLSGRKEKTALYWLEWDYAFPGWADWDEDALPYVTRFLAAHRDVTETEYRVLLEDLQDAGLGHIRPEGVRAKLEALRPGFAVTPDPATAWPPPDTLTSKPTTPPEEAPDKGRGPFGLFQKK